MKALPGVVSVGGTSRLPLGSTGLTTSINVEGRRTPPAEWPEVQFRASSATTSRTMGIPIFKGRMFNEADADGAAGLHRQPDDGREVLPGEDPVGRQIRNSRTGPPWTIIGLIGDVKHGSARREPQPEMYVSTYQGPMNSPYRRVAHVGIGGLIDVVRAEAQPSTGPADLLASRRWNR